MESEPTITPGVMENAVEPEKIFSSADPSALLHVIYSIGKLSDSRKDLSPDDQFLQISAMKLGVGKGVEPHRHLENRRTSDITQESIIVISGEVEASYFDVDARLLHRRVLRAGDCTVTFRGGHSFKSLSDETRVYEVKNGPYLGHAKDRGAI